MQQLPKITVVTVVYNDVNNIEKTIQSVINQSYSALEYIIIDGGSTDSTLAIIEKYSARLHKWISEKDKGIYDAMNKGTQLATGQWINFMNSGDTFVNNQVLTDIFGSSEPFDNTYSVIYGDVGVSYGGFERTLKASPLTPVWKKMPFCHQSTFAATSLLQQLQLDTRYRFAADFNFFYTLWKKRAKFLYKPFAIATISNQGVSDTSRQKVISEYKDIVLKYDNGFKYRLYYYFYTMNTRIKKFFKKILGPKMTSLVIKARN